MSILCCGKVIFETKYRTEESEDFHVYTLLLVLTIVMTSDLEYHGNVENTKKSVSQEQNMTFYEMKKFLICTSDDKFWEVIILQQI